MKSVPLNATPRVLARRAGAKALRAAGRVPAIIYGRHAASQNLEVKSKDMEDLIHHSVSENLLVDLSVKDDARPKRLALVQEVQHYALTGKVLHVDFHEVAENEKVTIQVPVETVGEAEGVKTDGGTLEHVLFKIKVRALPSVLAVLLGGVSGLSIGAPFSSQASLIHAAENVLIVIGYVIWQCGVAVALAHEKTKAGT